MQISKKTHTNIHMHIQYTKTFIIVTIKLAKSTHIFFILQIRAYATS